MTPNVPYAEVIGDPVSHSKSPYIHRFWLAKLGIEGDYRATKVGVAELEQFLAERRLDPNWRGCNLTMPLKRAALAHADEHSPDVRQSGATNCLTRKKGAALQAWNFDIAGVAVPLARHSQADTPDHVATYVQIIGAGGAARAAGLGAVRAGYGNFEIFVREPETAQEFAALMETSFGQARALDALGPIRTPDDGIEDQRPSHVVINATPLGMHGRPEVPIDLSAYGSDTIVFDMVYDPVETDLLRQARERGMRTIDGLDMLIEQAAHGFRAFFGSEAPREYDAELRAMLIA